MGTQVNKNPTCPHKHVQWVNLLIFTVEFSVTPTLNGGMPTISGANLPGKFEAVGVHVHWGNRTVKGSEHVINGRRYDGEIHIVHKNVKYSTVSEATQYTDGLAVLGIMFEISRVSKNITYEYQTI